MLQPYQHRYLLFMLLLSSLFMSCERPTRLFPHKRVMQEGDHLAWARPDFDDRAWKQDYAIAENGLFWVRFEINLDHQVDQLTHKGLQMISIASYEAYWDDVLLHENGRVGTDILSEEAGTFISQFMVPDSLCGKGKHVLALRLSNFHNTLMQGNWNTFFMEEYLDTAQKNAKLTSMMYLLGGSYLIAAIYYFLLFLNQKRSIPKLLFSLTCLFFFALIIMEFLKFQYAYPYHFHYIRLLSISLLTFGIAFILPLFLCHHFLLPKHHYITVANTAILLGIAYYYPIISDPTMQLVSKMMLLVIAFITLYAVVMKRKGSWILLTALVLICALSYFSTYHLNHLVYDYDINLFVGFTLLVITILYLMAQRAKEQQQAYEASLLLSERLKNELLKKHIQPHFMMNTLTSIMEWVEIEPKKSIKFIEALAKELAILNDIADQKLIPIGQELDLCTNHLETMSYRKEIQYHWEAQGIDPQEMIPPAILHTLVENGITHSQANEEGIIRFKLSFERDSNQKKYELLTIAQNRESTFKKTGGTGLKYVQSRLTESYDDKWQLSSEAVVTGWRTSIVIGE